MKQLVFGVLLVLVLWACGESGPRPKSMTGWYSVTLTSIENPGRESGKDLLEKETNKASNPNRESNRDLTKGGEIEGTLDTSTLHGKLEYSARQFEHTMEEVGEQVSTLGKGLSRLLTSMVHSGISIKNGIMDDIRFDAELQEDGDIKIKDMPIDIFNVGDAKWEVDGQQFRIIRDASDSLVFTIAKKDKKQIILENREVRVTMNKKE